MGLTPDRSGSTVILSLIFPFVPVLVHKGKEKSLSFRYYFQPKACISVPLPSGVINLFRSLTGYSAECFDRSADFVAVRLLWGRKKGNATEQLPIFTYATGFLLPL